MAGNTGDSGQLLLRASDLTGDCYRLNRRFQFLEDRVSALESALSNRLGTNGVTFLVVAPWASTTTYGAPDLVTFNGFLWASIQGGNLNHSPDVSPTWWFKLG